MTFEGDFQADQLPLAPNRKEYKAIETTDQEATGLMTNDQAIDTLKAIQIF